MIRKVAIFTVIIAVVAYAVIRGNTGSGTDNEVTVQALGTQNLQASILASGRISHEDEVLLSTEVIGKVTQLTVEEGDRVEQGQLLLRIDDEALLANVQQTEATVRMQEIAIEGQEIRIKDLESQWDRNKRLLDSGLGNQDSFDRINNDLDLARNDLLSRQQQLAQAQATLEEIQNRLSKTRVFSPLTGVITSLDIEVGETAISSTTNVPGSSLMTIANPDSIQTEVNVDEADIGNVEVGQEVEIVAIAYPDTPMKGVVESIAMSAKRAEGSQSLSFVVKIRFTDTMGVNLRPGMSCRAEIFTHQDSDLLAVPLQAVRVDEDLSENRTDYYVFVNEDGTARKRIITVGIADDEYQEVTGGIEAGEEIITGPDRVLRILDDGDSVSVIEEDTDA